MVDAQTDDTPNVLAKICADKWQHIALSKKQTSEQNLLTKVKDAPPVQGFMTALNNRIAAGQNALIAEVKKASPSKGLIRKNFDHVAIATAYERAGATCISVLTDEPYFQGDDRYLKDIRQNSKLPLLRKDFMLDPYQVLESRVLGADCILLIMAALSDAQAKELEQAAYSLNMSVLVEVHNQEELERALQLKSTLFGINNRNLKTLEVDLATCEYLASQIPSNYTKVCESGVYTPADIARINQSNVHAFLVGESLMRQEDVERATKDLLA